MCTYILPHTKVVQSSAVVIMPKKLIVFSLFWNFVLFLAPGPAHSNYDSGDCTADNSTGKIVCARMSISLAL